MPSAWPASGSKLSVLGGSRLANRRMGNGGEIIRSLCCELPPLAPLLRSRVRASAPGPRLRGRRHVSWKTEAPIYLHTRSGTCSPTTPTAWDTTRTASGGRSTTEGRGGGGQRPNARPRVQPRLLQLPHHAGGHAARHGAEHVAERRVLPFPSTPFYSPSHSIPVTSPD